MAIAAEIAAASKPAAEIFSFVRQCFAAGSRPVKP